MIFITQVIVIIVAILIASISLTQRVTHFGKAWKKTFLVLLAVGMVVAVVFPQITNFIANFVGIGRGADLLLYVTVLAFIIYVLNNYLNQQDQRDATYRLARKLAVIEALNRYSIKRKN